jgi:Na+-transporting NADH:ubiquinone oxidoreductase subunit NqrF
MPIEIPISKSVRSSGSTNWPPFIGPASFGWTGHVGFIHDVLEREYLAGHSQPGAVEYYLCGPPAMIEAARRMLAGRGIDPEQVAFDEF